MAAGLLGSGATFATGAQAVYRTPPAVCPVRACQGPCACVPPGPWGYTARQWQPWPGDQYRRDIVFPQSIGVERVVVPQGEKPKPLPRETYAKPRRKIDEEAEKGADVKILDGAPLEPVPAPLPFEHAPGADSDLGIPELGPPPPATR